MFNLRLVDEKKTKTKSSQEIIVTRPQLNFKCRMKITIDIQTNQYLSVIRCKMFCHAWTNGFIM